MSKRHKLQHIRVSNWSLVADGREITLDANTFHNMSVAGLIKLTQDKCPQWTELVFTRHTVIQDTQKREGSKTIHTKDTVYKIGLNGVGNVGVLKVDKNMRNADGIVPKAINDMLEKTRE